LIDGLHDVTLDLMKKITEVDNIELIDPAVVVAVRENVIYLLGK
jgi:hypothetical protein